MSFAEGSADKSEVIDKFKVNDKDTGSPEVQVAILTKRLEQLTTHFSKHPADKHSRRGLLQIVSRRKKLLNYLRNEDVNRYRTLISELGLRK